MEKCELLPSLAFPLPVMLCQGAACLHVAHHVVSDMHVPSACPTFPFSTPPQVTPHMPLTWPPHTAFPLTCTLQLPSPAPLTSPPALRPIAAAVLAPR